MRYPTVPPGIGFNATMPATPIAGARLIDKDAIKFSLRTVDGRMHRFALTAGDAKWLLATFIDALFPRAGRLLTFWIYRTSRCGVQSSSVSGTPSRDGSPQDGQAV